MHQPLGEEGLLIRRDEEPIDNDVVDKVRSHCAGIADDSLGRAPAGSEDCRSAMRRITRQIYQDIDGIGLDRLGRPTIRGLTYIDEAIKGADQT